MPRDIPFAWRVVADAGESEIELQQAEEPCSYFDVSQVEWLPSRAVSHAPKRDPGEDSEAYYERAVEEVRQFLGASFEAVQQAEH